MICSLTGDICDDPVVSKRTGHIYERRVIEDYLSGAATCPHTQEPMTPDDLLQIQAYVKAAKPKVVSHGGVPQMLRGLQNEWDALMGEHFKLKQHVETLRQELSHALYQHDAACRVIARLTMERDRAIQDLRNTREGIASAVAAQNVDTNGIPDEQPPPPPFPRPSMVDEKEAMDVDEPRYPMLPPQIREEIAAASERIIKNRKKKLKKWSSLFPDDQNIMQFVEKKRIAVTGAGQDRSRVTCMDLHPSAEMNKYIVTGSQDCFVNLFDRLSGNLEAHIAAHTRPVSSVEFFPKEPAILSSSLDGTAVIWQYDPALNRWSPRAKFEDPKHIGYVAARLHPTYQYILSADRGGNWQCRTLDLNLIIDVSTSDEISDLRVHPNGQMFGLACGRKIKIWDLRDHRGCISTLEMDDSVTALTFSSNGNSVAGGDGNGVVKLWDVRVRMAHIAKLNPTSTAVRTLTFDPTSEYLAIGRRYGAEFVKTKGWASLGTLIGHESHVNGIRFGAGNRFICTSGEDNQVKIFADRSANIDSL